MKQWHKLLLSALAGFATGWLVLVWLAPSYTVSVNNGRTIRLNTRTGQAWVYRSDTAEWQEIK